MHHERLVNDNTFRTARAVLDLLTNLPTEQQQALEGPIHDAIRQGFCAYAQDLETLSRHLQPLRHAASSGSRERA
jgi:hypothetical protein